MYKWEIPKTQNTKYQFTNVTVDIPLDDPLMSKFYRNVNENTIIIFINLT